MCSLMEVQSTKQPYEAPTVEVVPIRSEGIICGSEVNGSNAIDGWGNGGTTNEDTYM